MRTTVNIREEALKLCKKKARELGTSLGEVISEAILTVYRERPARGPKIQYQLPVSGEGGLQSGVDLDSTAALEDIMEGRK